MLGRGLYFICIALSCFHAASEPVQDENAGSGHSRRRRADDKDGMAISREIFRNITKHLRESIQREGQTEKTDRGHLPKPGPYQSYHHHEHHWGPYFEGGGDSEVATVVTAHVGSEALLHCRVGMLKDKTVMWLRKNADSAQLLTVGPAPYAADSRIAVRFQYPNNWRLSINPVRTEDAGPYMCQISTHPPRAILANLTVLPPILKINGDETHRLKDRFYKVGSSINLACVISDDVKPSTFPIVKSASTTMEPTTTPSSTTTELTTRASTAFNRLDLVMNKSWSVETTTLTSTVSVTTTRKTVIEVTTLTPVTEKQEKVINNIYGLVWKKQGVELTDGVKWNNMSITYVVPSASQNDTGTYTCHLHNHSQAMVNVHVLIAGENQAAVHHDTWNRANLFWTYSNLVLALLLPIPLVLK